MQLDPDMAEPSTNEVPDDVVVQLDSTADDSGPSVDDLESRLRELQGAMDTLQTGDLDAAEQAIESLEQRMDASRD